MIPGEFIERLAGAVVRDALLGHGDAVVVGVSGGADSTALLCALCELNEAREFGWTLHAAHFHHGLRGSEADADAEFVGEMAHRLGVGCSVERIDPGRLNSGRQGSVEEAARKSRYEFLERVCVRLGGEVVAVGHQADDQAETILHHVVRGTGLRGLRGMRRKRALGRGGGIQLIRPLLGFRRAEVLQYLRARDLPYRVDSSNRSPAHTRNRIRERVIPVLCEQINPQAVEALLRLGEQADEVERFLSHSADRLTDRVTLSRGAGRRELSVMELGRHPQALQMELIRQAIRELGVGERKLSFGHLRSVLELVANAQARFAPDLPGGLRVRREGDRLILSRSGCARGAPTYPTVRLEVPGIADLPFDGGRIVASVERRCESDGWIAGPDEESGSEERLDFACVAPPLVFRGLHPGERFHPLGAPGRKKVSEFLTDHKVSAADRGRVPILCDQKGPLWVVPFRIDERAKLTDRTRDVLRLVRRL